MGGIPTKRSDQRMGHRTKAEKSRTTTAPAGAELKWPAPDRSWEKIARDGYASLKASGQSRYYEQSDVATAFVCAETMSRAFAAPRIRSNLVGVVFQMMNGLMCTEASRRQVRLELERGPQPAEDPKLAIMQHYREAAGAGYEDA